VKKSVIVVFIVEAALISLFIYMCYGLIVKHNVIERIKNSVSAAASHKEKSGSSEARKRYQETLAIAKLITPEREDEFIEKALSEIRAGRLKEALKYYDAVVKANPDNKRVWSNRAAVKTALGDYTGAVKDASVSIEIYPERGAGYLNRMEAYYRLGEWQKAFDDADTYIKAGKFDEKDGNRKVIIYLYKGELLARLGRCDEAIETLLYIEPECVSDTDKSYVYNWLGWSYEKSGNIGNAKECYGKAMQAGSEYAQERFLKMGR